MGRGIWNSGTGTGTGAGTGTTRSPKLLIATLGCVAFAGAFVAACGDDGADEAGLATPEVLARTDAASAAECPNGGAVVSSGLDVDRDGELSEAEIRQRTVLCNDAPAGPLAPVVVRIVAEPAGPHCAEGGAAVQSGHDDDRDGRLDDDEVEHTDYLCEASLVTRMRAEPAGDHCVAGGLAFQIGRDRDGDGELVDAEVEWTEYECSDVLTRDVTIRSKADAAALAHLSVIHGSLAIEGNTTDGLQVLSLPRLHLLDGALTIRNNGQLTQLDLPELTQLDDTLSLENNAQLQTISAPKLEYVGGTFLLSNNAALTGISMDALARVERGFSITNNALLSALKVPSSRISGTVNISRNPALLTLSFLVFRGAERIEVSQNASLTSLTISARDPKTVSVSANPRLATLRISAIGDFGNDRLGAVEVRDNQMLTTVTVQSKYVGSLVIADHPALASVSLLNDEITGNVSLFGNTAPHTLTFLASSSDRRTRIGGSLHLSGAITSSASFNKVDVAGNCRIADTRYAEVGFLYRVGGDVSFSHNPQLTSIFPPFDVGGDVSLNDNDALTQTSFLGDGSTITGLDIRDNAELVNFFYAGPWRARGSVRVVNNPKLRLLGFNATEIDGYLDVIDNPVLIGLDVEGLRHVGLSMTIDGNSALAQLSFPALQSVGDYIHLNDHALAAHVRLPALTYMRGLFAANNPRLPTCEAQQLCARFPQALCQLQNNDDTATCP
jgi:hypothetical protein